MLFRSSGVITGTTATFVINNPTQATSTNTGALQIINGGAGIGGNLYVGQTSYIAGAQIITTATIASYAASGVITGTTATFVINNPTQATSTNTGALQVVNGGVGIGGNLYVGGIISAPLGTGGAITGAAQITTNNLTVSGTFTSTNAQSVVQLVNGGTGIVPYDLNSGTVFYVTSPTVNWTANFINVGPTSNRMTVVTIIVVQGSSFAYGPTAIQINGTPATLLWLGAGSAPGGVANNTDVWTFNLLNISGTWSALGQHSTY